MRANIADLKPCSYSSAERPSDRTRTRARCTRGCLRNLDRAAMAGPEEMSLGTAELIISLLSAGQSSLRIDVSLSASRSAKTTIMNVGLAWLDVRKAELLATKGLLRP